jgi:hypothetical protein
VHNLQSVNTRSPKTIADIRIKCRAFDGVDVRCCHDGARPTGERMHKLSAISSERRMAPGGTDDGGATRMKGRIWQQYRLLSPDDQRTFKYWLKANAVAGVIASVALVAMICLSANSARPSNSVVTAGHQRR